ncbi:GNAT family N-acetyltransferase [Candidatus Woesearchaeota archaeon]|nr:GNAT family N-acetyltransferase [Candidatus Woesearchaeota archaeon]
MTAENIDLEERVVDFEAIPEKPEWREIARAYKEAIEQTSFYRDLSEKVVESVNGRNKVLDLGCGTGAHLDRILEANTSCEVVGVDSSIEMLRIANSRLAQDHPGRDFRLYYADGTTFNKERHFDAIISSNVLFNLENPMGYLDNALRLLSHGGVLVLTSPFAMDVDGAEEMMREDFRKQRNYEEKEPFIDTVWRVNRSFPGRSNMYSQERMHDILLDFIGFDEILSEGKAYGSNFFFVAKKSESPSNVSIKITDDPELMEKGFRLRYHWLFDRHRAIPEKEGEVYRDPCDERSIGAFAVEEGTGRVVGFLNYVPPGDNMPFSDKGLLAQICQQYGDVGAFNGYYIVKAKQGKGVGRRMVKGMMQWAAENGISAIVSEANPEIVRSMEPLGWHAIGPDFQAYGNKNLPSTPTLATLENYSGAELEIPVERLRQPVS